jgi:uncharacterized protein
LPLVNPVAIHGRNALFLRLQFNHMRLLILLLLPACLFSACRTTRNQAPELKPVQENALLWEISGKGMPAPSYLFGTIHMICPEDFRMSDSTTAVFGRTGKLYLEIDMDDPAMALKTMQLAMMKEGSLKDLMSAEDYAALNRFMTDSMKMPLAMFNKMKPFTLMSLLYTKILPCPTPKSYEQQFMAMAAGQKKEVLGLERLEDQFAVFDQIPDSAEARMILSMIRDFDAQRAEFARMVDAYKKQDLAALSRMMESSPDMKGFEEILLYRRNRNWIPVMESAMATSPCFFAVGAGHLPGPEGVISLLRKAGYRVVPVE